MIMPTMMMNPHHSWNDQNDEDRAAQFHSEKPNVKVVISQNN